MTSPASNMLACSEVTVASSINGAPRLEFALFSDVGNHDDADKSALPRSHSSSNMLDQVALVQSPDKSNANAASLNDKHCRARSNSDRANMGDLIDFLRSVSPPPQHYLPSTFEDEDMEVVEDSSKWKQLRNKLRLRLNSKPSSPTEEIHFRANKLPDSAVATRTSRGHPHIAISIPMEHCHVGPDSDWAVAAFNPTKPLTCTTQVDSLAFGEKGRKRKDSHGRENQLLGTPETTHDRGQKISKLSQMAWARSSVLHTKDLDSPIRLWQATLSPMSLPQSPPTTASSHTTSIQATRVPMPMDPDAFVEVPRFSCSSMRTPESIIDDRMRKVNLSWMTTTHVLQSAPGPPPRSAPQSPHHSIRRGSSSKYNSNSTRTSRFPSRATSLRTPAVAEIGTRDEPSIDRVLDVTLPFQPYVEKPEYSPSATSEDSLSPSVETQGSEPIVAEAKAARGFTSNSLEEQATPGTTPRASLVHLPRSRASPPPMSADKSHPKSKPVRHCSVKSSSAQKSRAERVKSLKKRDIDAAMNKKIEPQEVQQQQENGSKTDERPDSTETTISTLRLPSRDESVATPCVATFADRFPRPPTVDFSVEANSSRLSQLSDSGTNSPRAASVTKEHKRRLSSFHVHRRSLSPFPAVGFQAKRSSDSSFEPPRRYNSHNRTSWASSIPLLDRISSYAPSESSMQTPELAGSEATIHFRSDSATLPRLEQDKPTSSPLSYLTAVPDDAEIEASPILMRTTGSQHAPEHRSFSRFDVAVPEMEEQPLTPTKGRWSLSSLQSPGTVVAGSSPPTSVTNSWTMSRASTELTPPQSARGSPTHVSGNGLSGMQASGQHSMLSDWPEHHDATTEPRPCMEPEHDSLQTILSSKQLLNRLPENDQLDDQAHPPSQSSGAIEHYGPRALLRMSSTELRKHYAAIRRVERASDLAQQIINNQERLELDMRRRERNEMIFLDRLERTLEALGHRLGPSARARSSMRWAEEQGDRKSTSGNAIPEWESFSEQATTSREQSASPDRQSQILDTAIRGRRRHQRDESGDRIRSTQPATRLSRHELWRRGKKEYFHNSRNTSVELDAMNPLIRELQEASRVSLEESPRSPTAFGDGGEASHLGMI